MKEFFDAIRRTASRHPAKKALVFYRDDAVSKVTYGDLHRDLVRCAQSADGASEGDLVLISSGTNYPSVLNYLAALRNGAHPAFLAPLTSRQDPQIFRSELALLIGRFAPNRVLAETFADERRHDRRFLEHYEPGFVQFSSGTTGLRKGVFISGPRFQTQLDSLGRVLGISDADVIASWLPLYHDMGLISSLMLPLYFGCTVTFLDPVEWSYRPESLLRVICRERATLCWQPDFAFRHIVNRCEQANLEGEDRLDSLRLLVNCSEPCRKRTFTSFWQRFRAAGLGEESLQTCYAMAENVFGVTQSAFGDQSGWSRDAEFLSSGRPLPGCEVRVAGGLGQDGIGEIEVSGTCLFGGYLNQPAPPAKFVDRWFATGDLGFIQDGELYVIGRMDDTLIINGRKLLAHQIEDHVSGLPGLKPGRAICVANAGNSAVTIFYEGEGLDAAAVRQLKVWCATATGASIDQIRKLEPGTIVKSSSGKLARRKSIDKLTRLGLV